MMSIIKKIKGPWIARSKSKKYESPLQRTIQLIFHIAIDNDADMIVFGEPPSPYEVEEHPAPLTLTQLAEAGKITQEEMNEMEMLERRGRRMQEEIDPLIEQLRMKSSFVSSPVLDVPVMCRRHGKWFHSTPTCIENLHDLIGCLEINMVKGINIDDPGLKCHVQYSIGMENNYCYYIKIIEVNPKPN